MILRIGFAVSLKDAWTRIAAHGYIC